MNGVEINAAPVNGKVRITYTFMQDMTRHQAYELSRQVLARSEPGARELAAKILEAISDAMPPARAG